MTQKGINLNELPTEARKKVQKEVGIKVVPDRMVVLGRILQELEGMTNADALWTLRKAIKVLGGK
jgi:hypothetical protein